MKAYKRVELRPVAFSFDTGFIIFNLMFLRGMEL